jgi:hypothetical protein
LVFFFFFFFFFFFLSLCFDFDRDRKLLQVLVGPALSAEVTLLASKMLFCQTQRIAKLDIVSFELIQVAARLLAEFSAMSQCSACYILLSVLNVDDGSLGSMSDVLIELKIPRALTNLLVIEEDNLSATLQVGRGNFVFLFVMFFFFKKKKRN